MLVGPKSNPALLNKEEDILTMFNKIVTQGNIDVAVRKQPCQLIMMPTSLGSN